MDIHLHYLLSSCRWPSLSCPHWQCRSNHSTFLWKTLPILCTSFSASDGHHHRAADCKSVRQGDQKRALAVTTSYFPEGKHKGHGRLLAAYYCLEPLHFPVVYQDCQACFFKNTIQLILEPSMAHCATSDNRGKKDLPHNLCICCSLGHWAMHHSSIFKKSGCLLTLLLFFLSIFLRIMQDFSQGGDQWSDKQSQTSNHLHHPASGYFGASSTGLTSTVPSVIFSSLKILLHNLCRYLAKSMSPAVVSVATMP